MGFTAAIAGAQDANQDTGGETTNAKSSPKSYMLPC
jgi:hypothetical protein